MARMVAIVGLPLGWAFLACCLVASGEEASRMVELIQERYPDGSVKLAREMTQDAEGNYINHGSWTLRDEQGVVVEQGTYRHARRHGEWTRHYQKGELKILAKSPHDKLPGPFVSKATFDDDQLHGKWTIHDGENRPVFELTFVDGERHGTETWWHANGARRLQVTYKNGLPDGDALKWDENEKLVSKDQYVDGRKLAKRVEYYSADSEGKKANRSARGRKRKSEGMYLLGKLVPKTADDWSAATFATYKVEKGLDKHGPWKMWHPNGQSMEQGEYRHNEREGKFTRWSSNGQKELEGAFAAGKQHGEWTWWHANGLKMSRGSFEYGTESGAWKWWEKTGKLQQSAEYSSGAKKSNIAGSKQPEGGDEPSSAKADDAAPAFPSTLRR